MRFGRGGRKTIREVLEGLDVPEAEIIAAETDGTLPLLAIEHLVFEDRPVYDSAAVADSVGLPRTRSPTSGGRSASPTRSTARRRSPTSTSR